MMPNEQPGGLPPSPDVLPATAQSSFRGPNRGTLLNLTQESTPTTSHASGQQSNMMLAQSSNTYAPQPMDLNLDHTSPQNYAANDFRPVMTNAAVSHVTPPVQVSPAAARVGCRYGLLDSTSSAETILQDDPLHEGPILQDPLHENRASVFEDCVHIENIFAEENILEHNLDEGSHVYAQHPIDEPIISLEFYEPVPMDVDTPSDDDSTSDDDSSSDDDLPYFAIHNDYIDALPKHQWVDFGYFKLPATTRPNQRHYVPAKWVEDALRDLISTDQLSGENPLYTVEGCVRLESVGVNSAEIPIFDLLGPLATGEPHNQQCQQDDRLVDCMDVIKFVRFVMHGVNVIWGDGAFRDPFLPPQVPENEFGFIKFTNGIIVPYAKIFGMDDVLPAVFFKNEQLTRSLPKFQLRGLALAYVKYASLCLNFPEAAEILQKDEIETFTLKDIALVWGIDDRKYKPNRNAYDPEFVRKAKVRAQFPAWLAQSP